MMRRPSWLDEHSAMAYVLAGMRCTRNSTDVWQWLHVTLGFGRAERRRVDFDKMIFQEPSWIKC
jgi:hypothetical protein